MLGANEITTTTWDDLEAILIQADMGVSVSRHVIASMQHTAFDQGLLRTQDLLAALRAELRERLPATPELDLTASPFVVFVVGVNGSGKTTTIAKLARYFQTRGGVEHEELGIPILFAGLGETPKDLEVFDTDGFIEGILQ